MRNLVAGGLVLAACSAMGGTFPYNAEMRVSHQADAVSVDSLTSPFSVPAVDGGMKSSESVAFIYLNDVPIREMELDEWEASQASLASAQVAFTLVRAANGESEWRGYTASSQWVVLTGVEPEDGIYDVKIEIDYSPSWTSAFHQEAGVPKVRYLIRAGASEGEYTTLIPEGGSADGWVAIGCQGVVTIGAVDVYGCLLDAGSAEGKTGVRPAEGSVVDVNDVSMDFDAVKLTLTSNDDIWGVDKVQVTLKTEKGTVIGTQAQDVGAIGKDLFFTFSGLDAGVSYHYDINLIGSYGGSATATEPVESNLLDLFSHDGWFFFDSQNNNFVRSTADDGITVEDGFFRATDQGLVGYVTPVSTNQELGAIVTTTMELPAATYLPMPEFDVDNVPQFAIGLGQNPEGERKWQYFFNGAWHDAAEGLPTESGVYEGRASFNYVERTFRYEIRLVSQGPKFSVLVNNLPLADNTMFEKFGLRGSGHITALTGEIRKPTPQKIEIDETTKEIPMSVNAEIDLAGMSDTYTLVPEAGKKRHLKWKDASDRYAKLDGNQLTVYEGEPKNDLKSYDSYVLGLNADDQFDRPVAVIKPGTDTDTKVSVYMPNVKVNEESGREVKFRREKSEDGGETWTNDGEFAVGDVEIPLNTDSTQTKTLYRVNTIFK